MRFKAALLSLVAPMLGVSVIVLRSGRCIRPPVVVVPLLRSSHCLRVGAPGLAGRIPLGAGLLPRHGSLRGAYLRFP
jgi:hypothetical protein